MTKKIKVADMDNIEQNNSIDVKTGLTSLQENVAHLLVGGKNITDISNTLDIARNTIYNWQEQPMFQAYCNRLSIEIKRQLNNSISSLYNEAIEVIREGLTSDNERMRLKSAFYIMDKVLEQNIQGYVTPRDVVHSELNNKTKRWNIFIEDKDVEEEMKNRGLE